MIFVEKHIIKKSNSLIYNELDELCFFSKNLYNSSLFEIRKYFFETSKYLNKFELINKFTKEQQKDYIKLPRKVSQQVIYQVDQNFKSFFALIKNKKQTLKKIKIPKYLDKSGRNILVYTNQAISSKFLKKNLLKLSGTNFTIKIQHTNINQVRVIKRINCYIIEVLYETKEKDSLIDNNRYCGIDLGINNLMTIGSNCLEPIIITGKPLKSINHFYNKKLAKLKSRQDILKSKAINKRKIEHLHFKRNNKINDYLHKASRKLLNHLVSNNINTIVIGLNKLWKQESNLGKRNNQNFIQIPHSKLIEMIKYKCKLEGINCIIREESYTSKCSFLDNEEICKHETYLGKRIKRGLFKSANNILINADLNGALNILKKEIPNAFNKNYGIKVCSTPRVLTLK